MVSDDIISSLSRVRDKRNYRQKARQRNPNAIALWSIQVNVDRKSAEMIRKMPLYL
jgi:hypothetical protein